MYLLVVKDTGEVIVAKPDNPKPKWGKKEKDGSFFEIVHIADDRFKLGADNAMVGMPSKDVSLSSQGVIDKLKAKAAAGDVCPHVGFPFRTTKLVSVHGVETNTERCLSCIKIDLKMASAGEEKEISVDAIKANFTMSSPSVMSEARGVG